MENKPTKPEALESLPGPDDRLIEEVEPKLRLGVLIRRYRTAADMTLRELAEKLELPTVNLGEVERGMAVLKAETLQRTAEVLNVLYEPLLMATRDWNWAVFEEHGAKGGVELTDTTVTEAALRGGEELLERELIRAADDLAFLENVFREAMVKAGKGARRARALLLERGVPIPDAPETQLVNCLGPVHGFDGSDNWKPHQMRLGLDFVLSYQSPADDEGKLPDKLYFCSESCAHEFRVANGIEPSPDEAADGA